jgi:hypothetical protein
MSKKKSKSGSTKRPKRNPVVIEGDDKSFKRSSPVVRVEIPEERRNSKFFRYSVGLTYVTTPGCSMEDLMHVPEFKGHVTKGVIAKWSKEDRWVERRAEFVEKLTAHVTTKVCSDLANMRIVRINKLQLIYDKVMEKFIQEFEKGALEFRSLDGSINCLTRMAAVIDDQQEKLTEQVLPAVPKVLETSMDEPTQQDLHQSLVPQLNQAEGRDVIRMLLSKRRAQLRQELMDAGELKKEDIHGSGGEVMGKRKKRPPKKKSQ